MFDLICHANHRHKPNFQMCPGSLRGLNNCCKNIPKPVENSAVQPNINWSCGLLAQSPSFSIQAWVAKPNWWKMTPTVHPPNHGNNMKQPETGTEFSDVFGSWRGENTKTSHTASSIPELQAGAIVLLAAQPLFSWGSWSRNTRPLDNHWTMTIWTFKHWTPVCYFFLGTLSLLLSWLLNTSDLLVIIDFSIVLVYPLININIIIIVIIIIIIIILMGSYHHYHYYPWCHVTLCIDYIIAASTAPALRWPPAGASQRPQRLAADWDRGENPGW